MAFNWAGAASGAYEGLQDAIRQRMVEQEFQQRQAALAEQQQWRRMQAEINQQNADSLAESRRAVAEEKKAKVERYGMQNRTALETIQARGQNLDLDYIEDPVKRENVRQYYVGAAQHWIRTGEELPDAVTSSYFSIPKEKVYTPKTEEQFKDEERSAEIAGKARVRYHVSDASSGRLRKGEYPDWDVRYGADAELPLGPQQWITRKAVGWLNSNLAKKDVAAAYARAESEVMREFDQQVASGNPYLSLPKVLATFKKIWDAKLKGTDPEAALDRSIFGNDNEE